MEPSDDHWPVKLGQWIRDVPTNSVWRVKSFTTEARRGDEAYPNLYVTLELGEGRDWDGADELKIRMGKVVLFLHSERFELEDRNYDSLGAEASPKTEELDAPLK
jgi:hypothetical protein